MITTATGAYEAKQAPIVNEGKLLNRRMQLIAEYENCYQKHVLVHNFHYLSGSILFVAASQTAHKNYVNLNHVSCECLI
jgi:hypothetical protein